MSSAVHVKQHILHRPFPLPVGKWMMQQTWQDLLLAHWPVPHQVVRPLVHPHLQIDTYQGQAWVSIIPFLLKGIRLRGLPVTLFAPFAEVNLRTYVHYDGKPGVYFISLDASKWLAPHVAKVFFHLPYVYADIDIRQEGKSIFYHSRRKHTDENRVEFQVTYRPVSDVYAVQRGTLEYWLTERYCYYSVDGKQRMYCGDIHHQPWPLQKAQADIQKNSLAHPYRISLADGQPIYHFVKRMDAWLWNIERVE